MSFNKAKALKTASKYVQQGKYQSAIEEYRQIAQADPSDVTTLNTLGDLYVKVGQTSEAIASFLHIAEHYRVSGFYLKAIAMLKKVSKLAPSHIEVSLKLAGLYAQQKLIVDARHQYLSVAEHYIREGQTQEALAVYQKIADLDPENTAVQIKLAEAFLREDQADKAYDTFVLAAGEMRRQNKEGEALQTYLRAIKAHPRGQAALAAAVNLYLDRGEFHSAIELIEGLLAERPNDAELLTLLARIHQATQNLEAAESAIEKMLVNAHSRYQYAVDLALLYVQRADVTGALRVFDRVAETLYEYREEEKAAQLLREILALEPQHLGALTRLSAVYERTHDDHLLIETLNLLADAAIQTGSEPAAISALKRLLELEPDEIQHRRRLREMVGTEEVESAAPPKTSNYENNSAAHSAAGRDFWEQTEYEEAAFTEFQAEATSDFTSSSSPGKEESSGVTAGNDESAEQWGNWTSGTTPAPATAAEASEGFGSYEVSVEPAASSPSFFTPAGSEPAPLVGVTVAESFEVTPVNSTTANLRDELESVDFYLHQGMLDVARYTLESVAAHFPKAPEVAEKFAQLNAAEARSGQAVFGSDNQFEVVEEVAVDPLPSNPVVTPEVEVSLPQTAEAAKGCFGRQDLETGYLATPVTDFEATPETEKAAIFFVQPNAAPPPDAQAYALAGTSNQPEEKTEPAISIASTKPPASTSFDLFDGDEMGDLLDFLDEFKAESEQHKPDEDFETHYNLGLAYKEMDMFEEAIEEFQQAFKAIMAEPTHHDYVSCCSMLAFCFGQRGLPRLAVVWLKKGLESPGRGDEVHQALRYELADAYAAMGELKDAYDTFAEVYAVDVQYRGVKTRMQEIAAQMGK
jgi:tetratricopeptide (TPR) repeat protein